METTERAGEGETSGSVLESPNSLSEQRIAGLRRVLQTLLPYENREVSFCSK